MTTTITGQSIVVEGIDDSSLVAEIRTTIHEFLEEHVPQGSWLVTVKPSRVSGRWDVCLQGAGVRHTISIAVPAALLPARLPGRLCGSLDQVSLLRLNVLRAARPLVYAV